MTKAVSIGALLGSVFICYYLVWAQYIPELFNVDGFANKDISNYVYKHNFIPVVEPNNPQDLWVSNYGTTRALRPPLTFLASGYFASMLVPLEIEKETALRASSAIFGGLALFACFIGFYLLCNSYLVALAGALALGLMPRMVTLSSTNNDDIGAVFSSAILFLTLVIHHTRKSKFSSYLYLAAALGWVVISKFTAWLYVPLVVIYLLIVSRHKFKVTPANFASLLGVFILFGGWWFLFNMYHYGVSDPMASGIANQFKVSQIGDEAIVGGYQKYGIGVTGLLMNQENFLVETFKSVVGYLYWIHLEVGLVSYVVYAVIILLGLWGVVSRISRKFGGQLVDDQQWPLFVLFVSMALWQFLFYVHHNVVRDTQPQGKYLLPALIPLIALFLIYLVSFNREILQLRVANMELDAHKTLALVSIVVLMLTHINSAYGYIWPAIEPVSHRAKLMAAKKLELGVDLTVQPSSSSAVELIDGTWRVKPQEQTGRVNFGESLCRYIQPNALISFVVESEQKGRLELYSYKRGRFGPDRIASRRFSAGGGQVNIVFGAKDCERVELKIVTNSDLFAISSVHASSLFINRNNSMIYTK